MNFAEKYIDFSPRPQKYDTIFTIRNTIFQITQFQPTKFYTAPNIAEKT